MVVFEAKGSVVAKLKAGKASFELKQMLPYVQRLVDMKALKPGEETDLINPEAGATEVSQWSLIGDVCAQCGEYGDATACLQKALALDPAFVPALKSMLRISKELDDAAEVRAYKARLAAAEGGRSTTTKQAKSAAGVNEDDVASWYDAAESTFFMRAWANDPRLEKPFRAWAKKAFPSHAKEQPKDAALLERLIVDEEGAGVMAGFLDALTKPLRVVALTGIRQDLLFAWGKKKPSSAQQALLANVDGYAK